MKYNKSEKINLMLMISLHRCQASILKAETGVITKHGITMPQFGVLDILYHKGPQKIVNIIEKTLSSGGNMTVVIDNLVKCNLVERLFDPEDRRARLISLTAKGETLFETIFPLHLKNLQDTLTALNDSEKEEFIRLAQKLGLDVQNRLTNN